jgi:ABC-type nitrate/sulfonate/bicarbonate transport system permease component
MRFLMLPPPWDDAEEARIGFWRYMLKQVVASMTRGAIVGSVLGIVLGMVIGLAS